MDIYKITFINDDPLQGKLGEVLQEGTIKSATIPTIDEIEEMALSGKHGFGLPAIKCRVEWLLG